MNLTPAKSLAKTSRPSARRLGRMFIITLCVFLSTAAPAVADTLRINQVVQTLTSSQGTPDLKLKTLVSQDPAATKGPAQQGGPGNEPQTPAQSATKTDSIIAGVDVTSQGQQLGVEIVEEGEVEGTICDCGEILVAGGAFPKWPFLFLGAVPLVFINTCNDCDEPPRQEMPTPTPPSISTPTPTPTPPGVPEPASLLLFGTGLAAFGAGLRRRYSKMRLTEQIEAQEE